MRKFHMRKLINPLANSRGSALIFALVFGVVFTILGISIFVVLGNNSLTLRKDIELQRAYWTEESDLNLACRYLSNAAFVLAPSQTYTIIGPLPIAFGAQLNGLYLLNFTNAAAGLLTSSDPLNTSSPTDRSTLQLNVLVVPGVAPAEDIRPFLDGNLTDFVTNFNVASTLNQRIIQ